MWAVSRARARSIFRRRRTPTAAMPSPASTPANCPNPAAAGAARHKDAFLQYRQWGVPVSAILTDNGGKFCGKQHYPCELYLALNGIERRRAKTGSPRANGFVERFNRTVLDEFLRPAMRARFYEWAAASQEDLDRRLKFYNHERLRLGPRNQGKTQLTRS